MANIPKVVALFETSLQAKINSSATAMTLVSGVDKAGNALSGLYGMIIDEGSSNEEFIIGSVTSTAVTSMLRGVSPADGKTEVAALKKEHRRGASVKITDFPVLGVLSRMLNGDETLPNLIKYATELSPTGDYDIVYKKWVEDRNGYWTGAVANYAALPIGSVEGEARVTLDDGKIYVWDIGASDVATILSVDTGTNVVTTSAAHGLSTGDYIYLYTTGTLPLGLATATAYYVYVDSTTEFHLSLAKAGATVDITGAVTDTDTIKEATWVLAGAGGGAGTVYVTTKLGTQADGDDNATFSLTAGSWADSKYLQVYLNGVLQELGASEDYTAADNNTIVFNTAIADTDKVTMLVVSVDLYNPAWGLVNASILPDTHNLYDIGSDGLRFKNAYFEGNVDIDGTLNVQGVATFQAAAVLADASALATSAAPTTDAMIANKKYVDDKSSFVLVATPTFIRGAANTVRTTNSTTYNKLKEIAINGYGGVIHTTFQIKDSGASQARGRIYKNGVAVGTERLTISTSYQTYTEDITVAAGDLIQVYCKNDSGGVQITSITNFQVGFILEKANDTTINTD